MFSVFGAESRSPVPKVFLGEPIGTAGSYSAIAVWAIVLFEKIIPEKYRGTLPSVIVTCSWCAFDAMAFAVTVMLLWPSVKPFFAAVAFATAVAAARSG